MKRLVTSMMGIATLFQHSVAQEGAGQTANEPVDEYCKILAEKFDDPKAVDDIMLDIHYIDGCNLASPGNQKALDWARRVLREKGQKLGPQGAEWYLFAKGDARDLDLMRSSHFGELLEKRVAGTNLIYDSRPQFAEWVDARVRWRGCVPSVTNTGPQGVYVEEILHKFWDQMEPTIHEYPRGIFTNKSVNQVPAELQTMVVWFGKDGNPICNVDLAKHGLSMPVIEPKPTANDPCIMERTVTFPPPSETLPQPAEPPPEPVTAAEPPPPPPSPQEEPPPPDAPPQRPALPVNILTAAALVIITLIALRLLRKRSVK